MGGVSPEYADQGRGVLSALRTAMAPIDPWWFYYARTILDFGCGCGFLASRMSEESRAELWGLGFDSEAIDWLHANKIRPGGFTLAPEDAKTNLLPDHFALIYSLDAFASMNTDHQTAWLIELRRVAAPWSAFLFGAHRKPEALDEFFKLERVLPKGLLGRLDLYVCKSR